MNARGRNPFGVKLPSSEVFIVRKAPEPKIELAKCKYRFKINDASYLVVEHNNLEDAENKAKRNAARSRFNPGNVRLISITKII